MKPFQHDDLLYFRFETLPENGRVGHAVFSRRGGVSAAPFDSLNLSLSVPDERDRVYGNRRRVYGLYGRDTDTVVHAHLVHGADVARVTTAENGTWVHHVDGLITDQPGCVLAMNYADCAPIFLYDPVHHAIGLGHAGWKGAVVDLPGAMVRAMAEQFASRPADLIAAIGPCIGSCCYEVGAEVIDAVEEAFGSDADGLLTTDHRPQTTDHVPATSGRGLSSVVGGQESARPHFDLPAANRLNLRHAGVTQIETTEFCTACRTDLFFSHRAEKGRTGRFGTVFGLGM